MCPVVNGRPATTQDTGMADSRRRTARLHAGSRPEPPGMGAMRARKVARTRNAGGPLARVPASSARERLWRSGRRRRSEEHTSELQSLMRISYAVFCLKKKKETYSI